MGSTNVGSTLRFTPIAPKPSIIGISSSSTTKVSFNSSNQNFHFFSSEDSGISFRHPLDSTGCPVGFYTSSSGILQVCFKYLRIANFIEECNKNFNWTSTRIYWTSSRIALLDVSQSHLEQKIWRIITCAYLVLKVILKFFVFGSIVSGQ